MTSSPKAPPELSSEATSRVIFATSHADLKTVCSIGESALIASIGAWLGPVSPPAPAGMGDDCAVLEVPPRKKQLLTTDSVTYGQHFDKKVSAKDAGAKLIKRNLSDIAAMGGTPGPALLNLLMGPDLSIDWLEAFIGGIREVCERYKVSIVGGDVSQIKSGQFSAALTLAGYVDKEPLLRRSAAIGDSIYVTGTLGGSLIKKHYAFEPRLKEGHWLAGQDAVTSMMDLTDGLAKDLGSLLPVSASAEISPDLLPLSKDAQSCSEKDGRSAAEHAFCDGEDYELLFTISAGQDCEQFESAWRAKFPDLRLTRIGRIIEAHKAGRFIEAGKNEALPWSQGFEHFKER